MVITIPPMTHPLGRYWDQPSREEILIDEKHALMQIDTFSKLHEYSSSIPSGVYEGKMWRAWDPKLRMWVLRWFGESEKPGYVSNNQRTILFV